MTKTLLFTAMLVVTGAGAANAGGQANSLGLGAEAELNGLGGVSIAYDGGMWDASGFLGYLRIEPPMMASQSVFEFGGRFFYHIHKTGSSDFGLGGGLALASLPPSGNRTTPVFLEPGFQVRMFIVPNVAVSFMGGLSIGLGDATTTSIDGQTFGGGTTFGAFGIQGGAAIHYFFF